MTLSACCTVGFTARRLLQPHRHLQWTVAMASRLRSGCGALRRTASSDRLAAGVAPAPTPTSLAPPLAAGRHRLALHFRGHGLGVGVPGEMWGAVALAARFTQPPASQAALPRSPSVIAQVGCQLLQGKKETECGWSACSTSMPGCRQQAAIFSTAHAHAPLLLLPCPLLPACRLSPRPLPPQQRRRLPHRPAPSLKTTPRRWLRLWRGGRSWGPPRTRRACWGLLPSVQVRRPSAEAPIPVWGPPLVPCRLGWLQWPGCLHLPVLA